jgi:hypothetical protein
MRMMSKLLLASLLFVAGDAFAYEGQAVSAYLRAARGQAGASPTIPFAAPAPVPATASGGVLMPPAPAPVVAVPVGNSQADRLENLNQAYGQLVETCEGRFGVLNSRLRRQTIRAETISVVGGFVGVLGAVATCPHCAALASGIAGLANPLQQTFKESSDTPQDTKSELRQLSETLREDLKTYRALPPRIDALQAADSSCRFYAAKATAAGEGESAPAKPGP